MWYWDHFPSGAHHKKKPLTRRQIAKMKENYAKAEDIIEHVKRLESEHEDTKKDDIKKNLDTLFL